MLPLVFLKVDSYALTIAVGWGEGLCLVPCLCEMPFIIDEDILFQCLLAQDLGAFPGCVQPLALQRREDQVVFTAGVQHRGCNPRAMCVTQ